MGRCKNCKCHSDKELNLFPTLQRIDSLGEAVELLVKKLNKLIRANNKEQIENNGL